MKILSVCLLIVCAFPSCESKQNTEKSAVPDNPMIGTWQLISGTTIQGKDTTVTDYTKNKYCLKIINSTHFAFVGHDLNKGKDSAAVFSSGGGSYSLMDSLYTEHLQYCSDRQWEGNSFNFTITIIGDTLIQKGIEKIEKIGVNRINIEKYVRVKK